MDMEPFDYLTYKQNKQQKQQTEKPLDRKLVYLVSGVSFIVCFLLFICFISSKASKIDIEYSAGDAMEKSSYMEDDSEDNTLRIGKYTIDKRLFLIQQEEKGPSESKIVQPAKEQTEVISKEQFEKIKNNNEEVVQKAEKKETELKLLNIKKEAEKETPQVKSPSETEPPVAKKPENISPAPKPVFNENKPVIKPKLPTQAEVHPVGSYENQAVVSKVLVGRYSSIEDATSVQNSIKERAQGLQPYVKQMNNYYTVQIGSYRNFETAKAVAGKLKSVGYDVWILQ